MSLEVRRRLVALGLLPECDDRPKADRAIRVLDFAAWLQERFPRKPRGYVRVATLSEAELEARRATNRVYGRRARMREQLRKLQAELDQYNQRFG